MATRKDIEVAERFVETLTREMSELKNRVHGIRDLFERFDAEESALRALIAHAKQTLPAEPQPGNHPVLPEGSPAARNQATPDDYETMHDYFDRGEK